MNSRQREPCTQTKPIQQSCARVWIELVSKPVGMKGNGQITGYFKIIFVFNGWLKAISPLLWWCEAIKPSGKWHTHTKHTCVCANVTASANSLWWTSHLGSPHTCTKSMHKHTGFFWCFRNAIFTKKQQQIHIRIHTATEPLPFDLYNINITVYVCHYITPHWVWFVARFWAFKRHCKAHIGTNVTRKNVTLSFSWWNVMNFRCIQG